MCPFCFTWRITFVGGTGNLWGHVPPVPPPPPSWGNPWVCHWVCYKEAKGGALSQSRPTNYWHKSKCQAYTILNNDEKILLCVLWPLIQYILDSFIPRNLSGRRTKSLSLSRVKWVGSLNSNSIWDEINTVFLSSIVVCDGDFFPIIGKTILGF